MSYKETGYELLANMRARVKALETHNLDDISEIKQHSGVLISGKCYKCKWCYYSIIDDPPYLTCDEAIIKGVIE